MKLIINKFPPINQKSVIDLSKKMMVFVGENNSGKTYISKLIWAIFNIDDMILYKDDIEIFNGGGQVLEVDLLDVKDKIEELYNKHLNEFLNKIFKNKEFDIRVVFEKEDFEKIYFNVFSNVPFNEKTIVKYKDSTLLKFEMVNTRLDLNKNIDEKFFKKINKTVYYIIIKSLLNHNTVYLPESRLDIPKIYKHLLVSQKQKMKELAFLNFTMFSEDDFIKNESLFNRDVIEDRIIEKLVLEIETERERDNEYVSELENILEGKIKAIKNEDFGFPYFVYHNNDIELPLEESSSMVNQLALLYLFFKYWYEKDNFLIIGEPELGLHPQKQMELMEFLMVFASKNKLLITTQSDIIMDLISNHFDLIELKNKNRDKYQKILKKFSLKDIDIESKDIGLYYFDGDTIIPYIDMDLSYIHFKSFAEVKIKLSEIYWVLNNSIE